MSLKVRRIIFYILLTFFVFGGIFATFYLFGYRLNLHTFTFQKTGGIFIRSAPGDANIVLNHKPIQNKSSILQNGTFISGLTPGEYTVKVFKSGFRNWEKKLIVESSFVSEASRIFLVPEDLSFLSLQTNVTDVWVRNDSMVVQDAAHPRALVDWTPDRQSGIFLDRGRNTFFISKLQSADSSLNLNVLFNNVREQRLGGTGTVQLISAKAHPFDPGRFIVATKSALYVVDSARLTIDRVGTSTVGTFEVGPSNIFWAEGSIIWSYNLIVKTTAKISELPSPVTDLVLSSSGAYIAARTTVGALTIIPTNGSPPFVVALHAAMPHFAPDDKKIAFFGSDGRLMVYFLDDFLSDIRKHKGEIFAVEVPQGALADFQWHNDSFHFFARAGSTLIFSEIDDRPPRNTYVLADGISKYVYDGSTKMLYLLKAGTLSRLKFEF